MNPLASIILAVAGAALSLFFAYFPKVKEWYEKQSGKKAIIMLGFDALVAGIYFGLGCIPVLAERLHIAVACDTAGLITLLLAFIDVVIANQATYVLTGGKNVSNNIGAYRAIVILALIFSMAFLAVVPVSANDSVPPSDPPYPGQVCQGSGGGFSCHPSGSCFAHAIPPGTDWHTRVTCVP